MDYYRNADHCPEPETLRSRTTGIKYTFDDTNYVEPVTVEEFKDYASIDDSTDDLLIGTFVKSARRHVENYLQKSLGVRLVKFTALYVADNFPLMYGDYDENEALFNNTLLKGGSEFSITLSTNANALTDEIKNAIMMQALHLYTNRERLLAEGNTSTYFDGFKLMLQPYKNIVWP